MFSGTEVKHIVQNPIILHDNAMSHTAAAHRHLALLAVGDSVTSTVLAQKESMRLQSLRQIERTTAKDPVHHKR